MNPFYPDMNRQQLGIGHPQSNQHQQLPPEAGINPQGPQVHLPPVCSFQFPTHPEAMNYPNVGQHFDDQHKFTNDKLKKKLYERHTLNITRAPGNDQQQHYYNNYYFNNQQMPLPNNNTNHIASFSPGLINCPSSQRVAAPTTQQFLPINSFPSTSMNKTQQPLPLTNEFESFTRVRATVASPMVANIRPSPVQSIQNIENLPVIKLPSEIYEEMMKAKNCSTPAQSSYRWPCNSSWKNMASTEPEKTQPQVQNLSKCVNNNLIANQNGVKLVVKMSSNVTTPKEMCSNKYSTTQAIITQQATLPFEAHNISSTTHHQSNPSIQPKQISPTIEKVNCNTNQVRDVQNDTATNSLPHFHTLNKNVSYTKTLLEFKKSMEKLAFNNKTTVNQVKEIPAIPHVPIKRKSMPKTIFGNQVSSKTIKTPAPIPISMLSDKKIPDDLWNQRLENLRKNIKMEAPPCDCIPKDKVCIERSPCYTHLGSAPSLPVLRKILEERLELKGEAIRIEKLLYTGKEGKTSQGCPIAKWIIRRSGPEEKVLFLVKHRNGHHCSSAWIVVVSVDWEGVDETTSDDLYKNLVYKLTNFGIVTSRKCGTNNERTCACQGIDRYSGASFSFGCSWSMYFDGCKFARSRARLRKFRLSKSSEEKDMENKFQELATILAPVYLNMAPESYYNQTAFEELGQECRLGLKPGRPWAGVTACMDFCAHSHKDVHNMNNGCTVILTLTKHRGFEKPEDEQLHVLPLYVLSDTDEFGSKAGRQRVIEKGGLEILNSYPVDMKIRRTPLPSCRQLKLMKRKKAGFNRSYGCRKKNLKISIPSKTPKRKYNRKYNGKGVKRPFIPEASVQATQSETMGIKSECEPMENVSNSSVNESSTSNPLLLQHLTSTVHKKEENFTSPLYLLSEAVSIKCQQAEGSMRDNNFKLPNPYLPAPSTSMMPPPPPPPPPPPAHCSQFNPLPPSPVAHCSQINPPPPPPVAHCSQMNNNLNLVKEETASAQNSVDFSQFSQPSHSGVQVNGFCETNKKANPLLLYLPYLRDATKAMCSSEVDVTIKTEPVETEERPTTPDYNDIYEVHSESVENFNDSRIGGVAIALSHGSVLFECAKHELHASTALKNPSQLQPSRIALVFYQHKNLNYRHHGEAEHKEKERQKELRELLTGVKSKSRKKKKKGTATVQNKITVPVKQVTTSTTNSIVTVFPFAPLIVTGPYQKWI